MNPIPAFIPFTAKSINTIIARNNQCNHLRFLNCRLKLKKLPEPIKNKEEKIKPQFPAQIELTVLTTPPKYFSRKIG